MNSTGWIDRVVLLPIWAMAMAMAGVAHGAEGWESAYAGEEVTGPKVVAIWQFKPGTETKDGKGDLDLKLAGKARFVQDDRFGGTLESFSSGPSYDKKQGAATRHGVTVPLAGAFTLEAWIKLKATPSIPDWVTGYIIDKMYIPGTTDRKGYNRDFYLTLNRRKTGQDHYLRAGVGLGSEVIQFQSELMSLGAEAWTHVAFCYNGKGTGMFFVNGKPMGRKSYADKGAAQPGTHCVTVGERVGSTYGGLPGYLAQVRISNGIPVSLVGPITVRLAHPFQRTAFVRMEEGQALTATITNGSGREIRDAVLTVGTGFSKTQVTIGDLGEDARDVAVPLPCDGKPGEYTLTATVSGNADGARLSGAGKMVFNICARLPRYMPVVMWGGASIEQMKQTRFTHRLLWLDHVDSQAWQAGEPLGFVPRFDETRQELNECLVAGLRVMGKMSPGGYFKHQKGYEKFRQPYLCLDANGATVQKVDFLLPRVQQFAYDTGRSIANNVGMYPAVDLMLTDSEFRDSGVVSRRPETRAAFKESAGYDIPALVVAKTGVGFRTIPDFPRDRVVPDNDRVLTFYNWYWGGGDGFPGFVTQSRRGVKARDDFRTLWDPAVRCASKWGSGGAADWLGHWTYVYPDPLVMSLASDEMMAMHKGGPAHQQITKMTQVIWYRSGSTGPMPEDKSKWAEWEKRLPDCKFITIPPDMLEIALWQKLSRPIQAIMYHGAGSLWPSKPGGYDYTHPGTAPRLASLMDRVVRPLGPMLLDVPDCPADVAMLESFAAQMFYGGMTYGSMRGPVGRMHGALTRAHMQTEIVYDETIMRDGLGRFKILVAPHAGVLKEGVATRIQEWQDRGGILVADPTLAPRLSPDIMLTQMKGSDKEESVAKAAELRTALEGEYTPYGQADTHNAVMRFRRFGSTDYLFVVNDNRTYGDYVGHHKIVMEKGLPLKTTMTIRRPGGTVYDLVAGKVVPTKSGDGALSISASLDPGEGRVYMITAQPIARVAVAVPGRVARTKSASIFVEVTDRSRAPMDAAIPLRVDVTDPEGQSSEVSGWYSAKGGTLTVDLDVAPNDVPGQWRVSVRELASGKTAQQTFTVE